MNPLNDDELNALLQEAKAKPPQPSRDLAARTLEAYQRNMARPAFWRRLLLRRVSLPAAFGAPAAVLLILMGALGERVLRAPSVITRTRPVEVPVVHERVVYRECPAEPSGSSPQIATLTFREMRPVLQIRPRVVRSIQDDQ
jgi:hypothetical protein